jgi:hypothetical protein
MSNTNNTKPAAILQLEQELGFVCNPKLEKQGDL